MRWKLIRRRLSISAPTMAVRSHLPWPVRWMVGALMLGFSAAMALWAFEFGRSIAGLNAGGRDATELIVQLRRQLGEARSERDAAQGFANSADSLLKAERVTQQRLAEQVKALERENQILKNDLGFFERLLPASGEALSVRGLQAEPAGPGHWRFQLLVMQQVVRNQPDFKGRVEVLISGTRAGRPWEGAAPVFQQAVVFRQYRRIYALLPVPDGVVVQALHVRVRDEAGKVRTSQTLRL